MAAIQLNFALRTSANCKTVHLLGSWDNYAGQLPLSKDSSKSGSWKGAFRFQSSLIKQGQRYWYYYILDGYHVSHDPAHEHTVEPTTGRKLNILDVPASATTVKSSRHSRTSSSSVAKGRPVSPARIACPQPYKPGQTKHIIASADTTSLNHIAAQLSRVQLAESDDDDDESEESDSDADSDVPSLTSSRSSASTSSRSSSVSSSSSCCTCERFGITRSGNRVRLDCGGSRCGYSDGDESSDCGSESENETYRVRQTRRQEDPPSLSHDHLHHHKHGPLHAKTKPMLRILTNLNGTKAGPQPPYPPDDKYGAGGGCKADTSETLRRLLKQRYAELAPTQMPPHLESPDAIVPPLTPAMVHYPTIKKRGRTETREMRQVSSAHPFSQHVPLNGWTPRSEWSWRT